MRQLPAYNTAYLAITLTAYDNKTLPNSKSETMVVLLMWYEIPVPIHFSVVPIPEGGSDLCKKLINQNMPDWD